MTIIDQLFPALEMYFCRALFNPPSSLSASFSFAITTVFVRSPPLGRPPTFTPVFDLQKQWPWLQDIQILALAFVIPEPPRISVTRARSDLLLIHDGRCPRWPVNASRLHFSRALDCYFCLSVLDSGINST